MHSMRFVVAAILVAAVAAPAWAADIRVPQDFANVKDALIAAQPGDRVIVTGGTWRNGRVLKAGTTLRGRVGATLLGDWEIEGQGATVEGFIVRDALLTVSGDDVTLRGNRLTAPRLDTMVSAASVTGMTFDDNRCTRAIVEMNGGTGQVVRGNRLIHSGFNLSGPGMLVEDNVLHRGSGISITFGTDAVVRGNTGGSLYVGGTTVVVERNSAETLDVQSDGALVVDNESLACRYFQVKGDDAIVRTNRVRMFDVGRSVVIEGERPVVTDNVVDNLLEGRRVGGNSGFLIVRGGAAAQVLRNEVSHVKQGGLFVSSDDAEVASNTLSGTTAGDSLRLVGDRIHAHDNTIVREAELDANWDAIVVVGADNVVTDISVSGAPYDGVLVSGSGNVLTRVHVGRAGRCGITVDETSASTAITDCTVDRAHWASLYVLGADTTVSGGSFTGGRKLDVLDLGTGTEFASVTFATKSDDAALAPYR